MKNFTELRLPLCLITLIGIIVCTSTGSLSFARDPEPNSQKPTPTPGSTGPTYPKRPGKTTDLRGTMKQMKLKEGSNLISSNNGIQLKANVKNGNVSGWSATDANGRALQTKTEARFKDCLVCVVTKTDIYCYNVPCKDAPKPPTRKAQ